MSEGSKTKPDPQALSNAAYKGKIEDVKSLLDSGADVNYQNDMGQTALLSASQKGYLDVAKLLVTSKADTNLQDKYGNTPLIKCCQSGKALMAAYLIEQNADVDHTNNDGDTAIIVATRRKHVDTVKELISHDADLQIVGSADKSVLDRARDTGNEAILTMIKDKLAVELLASAKTPRSKAVEFAAFKEMEKTRQEEEKKKKKEKEEERKKRAQQAEAEEMERQAIVREDQERRKASEAKDREALERANRTAAPILSQSGSSSNLGASGRRRAGALESVEEANTGVLVGILKPGSPAAKSGLKSGDLITHVNGRRVRNAQAMAEIVGKTVEHEFTVLRLGESITVATVSEEQKQASKDGDRRAAPSSATSTPVKDNFSSYPEPPPSDILNAIAHHPLSPQAYKRYISPVKGKHLDSLKHKGLISNTKVKECEVDKGRPEADYRPQSSPSS